MESRELTLQEMIDGVREAGLEDIAQQLEGRRDKAIVDPYPNCGDYDDIDD